jgi:hypothetical protein
LQLLTERDDGGMSHPDLGTVCRLMMAAAANCLARDLKFVRYMYCFINLIKLALFALVSAFYMLYISAILSKC